MSAGVMVLGMSIKFWAVTTHSLDGQVWDLYIFTSKAQVLMAGIGYAMYQKNSTSVNVGPDGVDVNAGGVNVRTGNSGVNVDAGNTQVQTGQGGVKVNTPGADVNAGDAGVNVDVTNK